MQLENPELTDSPRYFKAENFFESVDVYEQRSNSGGLWNHTESSTNDGLFQIPNVNPFTSPERPVGKGDVFVTPMYDSLEVNIPHPLMSYSDMSFEKGIPLFPGHAEVLKYLVRY